MGENAVQTHRREQFFSSNHSNHHHNDYHNIQHQNLQHQPHHQQQSRHHHHHSHDKRDQDAPDSDTDLSVDDPALLTSSQRKRLLDKRLKQLEDNDKLIMELQLKELSTGHTSRYSDRSRGYFMSNGRDLYPIGARGRANIYELPYAYERMNKDNGRESSDKTHSHPKYGTESEPNRTLPLETKPTEERQNGVHDSKSYNRARVADYLGINRPDAGSRAKLSTVSTTIPEDDILDDSKIRSEPNFSRFAIARKSDSTRNNRASILDKAERLLNERKQKEDVLEREPGDSDPRFARPRRNLTYVAKRSRSPSSDEEEFPEVPERVELDTDTASSYSLPQYVRASRRSYVPSVTQSEIPILYSDDDGPPPEPRPLTDTERNRYPYYRRYEQENDNVRVNYRDPAHKKIGRNTGALVKFFRNGDPDHRGVPLTVNRSFRNLETLLVMLNDKIPTPTGVKYIFKWPEGYEVKSVTDFQNRCVYVVSSTKNLRRDVNYGESRENFWSNKKPSAGRLRRNELGLYQKPPSPKDSPIRNAPLIVTLINNLARDKREKVILNPNTQQSFEEWLIDIHNHDMPVRGLFTEKPPHAQVKSFSHLFRELRLNNNLIACGDELLPLELTKKRQAPSSNSSNESVGESRSRKKKPPKQDMGQIYETGRAMSPTSTAMSRYDGGPKYPVPGQGRPRPVDSRRTLKDSVQFEIDGTLREFIPPTYIDGEDDGAKPDKMLKCEWVYGFRGRDARHNLLVLPETGELVYYVASVVVLYDKERDSQRVYNKHNEEITVMTLHPNNYLVATGQLHGKESEHASHIRIWHGVSLSTYSVIGLGVFYNGILSIGFSQDSTGKYMVALDGSEKHVLSVWDWETERIVARTTTSTDPVHCATFYPDGSNNSILITYGARHIYFWKIFYDAARRKEAKILRDRNSGIFEVKKKEDVPKSVNCLAFLSNGDVVTGDTSGNLMLWDRDTTDAFTCKFVIPAHDSSISTLCLLKDGTLLSGAGSEIKAWDTNNNFRDVKTRQIPVEAGSVRSIVTQTDGGNDGRLYIGTTHSAILDGSMQLKFKYLVQGHSEGIAGVVPHPFEPTFVSAGYDQVVYKWSLVTHKVIWRAHVGAPCTGVAVDHRHELVAIGTAEGTFEVLNSYNGMHIASVQVGTEPIGCLAFSPDGALLAMGCNDGLISVFAIHDRGQTFRKFNMALRGHNSGVSHLDWSTDGRCIQSVAHDHELIFWDVDSMQQIKIPRMMRDVDWFTNTCNVAYSLIGPWSNLVKDELIRVVNRSTYRDLMIIGDNKGRVRLYKYPCSKEKAEFRNVRVYSSDVTAVAFTPDTRTALTCGGNDAALIQWEVVDDQ